MLFKCYKCLIKKIADTCDFCNAKFIPPRLVESWSQFISRNITCLCNVLISPRPCLRTRSRWPGSNTLTSDASGPGSTPGILEVTQAIILSGSVICVIRGFEPTPQLA